MIIKVLRKILKQEVCEIFFEARDLRNVLYIFKASIKSFYKLLKQTR